jgi:hypothetical protein
MVTSKTESCTCVECQCDPCECQGGGCCGKSTDCRSSWCNWGAALRIGIAVGLVVAAFVAGLCLGGNKWDRDGGRGGYSRDGKMMMPEQME